MVTFLAIHGSCPRVDSNAQFEAHFWKADPKSHGWRKGIPRRLIANKFNPPEKSPPSNIAHVLGLSKRLNKQRIQPLSQPSHVRHQSLPSHNLLHRKRSRTTYRMGLIRLSMIETT